MKSATASNVTTKKANAQSQANTHNTSTLSGLVPFAIGAQYFIRTVTYHLTGRVANIVGQFLVLEDAAWIADSGRFTDAINSGKLNEVEPVNGPVIVNLNAITDAFNWAHLLPREQK